MSSTWRATLTAAYASPNAPTDLTNVLIAPSVDVKLSLSCANSPLAPLAFTFDAVRLALTDEMAFSSLNPVAAVALCASCNA